MRIGILVGLALSLAAISGIARGDETSNTEAYCYSFRWDVCLQDYDLISETITHPIDFTIHEIELRPKAHVTIYEGFGLAEQDSVTNIATPLSYETAAARIEVVTGHTKSDMYFDVHYRPKDRRSNATQFFGFVNSTQQAQAISTFLEGVHPCVHSDLGVTCTPDQPLERAAQLVTNLVKQ